MAVLTIFSDASDGRIVSGAGTTYSTVRAGTGLVADTTQTFASAGQTFLSPNYTAWEAFIAFDTSTVGTVNKAELTMSVSNNAVASQVFTTEVRAYDWGTSVTTADWIPGANLGNYPLVASLISSVSIVNGASYKFVDVALAANINGTGFTRFVASSDRLRLGTVPTTDEYLGWSVSRATGTSLDPKLVVWTVGSPFMVTQAEVANWGWVTTASKATAAFNANAGDLLVACGVGLTGSTVEMPMTISDSVGLVWTQEVVANSADTQYCYSVIWSAVVPAAQTGMTVTFTKKTANNWAFGGFCQVWRDAIGIGNTVTQRGSSVPPTAVSLTTTATNSAIVQFNADWTPNSGAPNWLQDATATPPIQTFFVYTDSTGYAAYSAYTADTGSIHAVDLGVDTPFNQRYSYVAAEVLYGAASFAPVLTAELWENGSLKQSLGEVDVDADGVYSFTWDAATLTALSGANVELRLSSDIDVDIGAIEWNALRVPGAPTIALAGTSAGAATVSGGLDVAHPLAGTTVGTSTTIANTAVAHPLDGTTTGTSTTTANLAVAHPLAGTTAGSSTATANTVVAHPLAATSAAASTTIADLTGTWQLAGTSAGSSSDTVAVLVGHLLDGTSNGVSTTVGAVTVAHPLAGSSVGASTVTAGLTVAHPLAATTAGASTTVADTAVAHPLAATSAGASTATASVSVAHPLAGTSASASTVTADAAVGHPLAGTSLGASTVVSDWTALLSFSATPGGQSVATGDAMLALGLATVAVGASTVTVVDLDVISGFREAWGMVLI